MSKNILKRERGYYKSVAGAKSIFYIDDESFAAIVCFACVSDPGAPMQCSADNVQLAIVH